MGSHEQIPLNYEEQEPQQKPPEKDQKTAIEKPMSVELDDECQYCGAPYESDRSCQYCRSNSTKRAYMKGQGK